MPALRPPGSGMQARAICAGAPRFPGTAPARLLLPVLSV